MKIRHKENELSSLNIEEKDYLPEPIGILYDPQLLQTASNGLKSSKEELRIADGKLQELKQAVCGITREAITSPWENLVEALNNKRQEEVDRYQGLLPPASWHRSRSTKCCKSA